MVNEQYRYLDLLLAHYCDVYIALSRGGRIADIRGKFEDVFKQPAEGLIGKIFWQVFSGLQAGDLYTTTQAALQNGRALQISGQLLPWTGWVEIILQPAAGGVELFVRDISSYEQEKGGTTDAEKSRVLFDALIQNIPEGILIADADDANVLVMSEYGCQHMAVPMDEILHRPFRDLLQRVTFFYPDGDRPVPYEEHPLIRALTEGAREEDLDLIVQNADGKYASVSCKYGPIHNEKGKIIAGIFSWMDISERKQAEMHLEETTRRLESSNHALETFAYSASHDLREPMRKIVSFSNILERNIGATLDENSKDLLERMRNAAVRMDNMIDSLLSYSLISSRPPALASVDLNQVLQNVLLDLEVRIQQTGAQVQVSDLPEVRADPSLMERLFMNLLANSLKFVRKGIPPQVSVYQVGPGTQDWELAEIVVEDNGIGFPESEVERIFQPFQRLHGRSAFEGSGLGLAICRQIAEQHGGHITAESRPEHGSIFRVFLPRSL